MILVITGHSCCTKINQLTLTGSGDHNIIRADITMNHILLMHHFQGPDNRLENPQCFFLIQSFSMFFQIFLQCHTIHIFHHHIRRFILKEKIFDRYDSLQMIKFCQASGFCCKFLQTVPIILFSFPSQ